jgi:methylenetetrahydrofolate reductase (NADPH)
MKISEIVATDAPSVSFEVFPPKRRAETDADAERAAMAKTKEIVREIAALKPSFMSVTYGAAGGSTGANTCEVASFVQNDCGVTALAHMTCIASSKAKVADEVWRLREAKVENVLCLRGDCPPDTEFPGSPDFRHASDLVRALANEGFCLGGACYPEGHPECAHLSDDIAHLKAKVDAGLDFLTTQMFFDNNVLFHYLARLRAAGVTVPVIAGVMPVTNGRQIKRICDLSGTYLPPRFRAIVDRFGDDPVAMMDAGVAYATEQIVDLFANGVAHVHVYTMNKPEIAIRIMRNLHGIVRSR